MPLDGFAQGVFAAFDGEQYLLCGCDARCGWVADRFPLALRFAVAVLALRDRVWGLVLVAFFLFGVFAEGVRRDVRFFVLLLRADVVVLVAMTLSFYGVCWTWTSRPVALGVPPQRLF
jgi:hypothetical protein